MSTKPWPENVTKVSFERELTRPFLKAIRFAYSLRRKNEEKDIPYEGFDRDSLLHIDFPIPKRYTASQLKYDKENQGRDALEVIIGTAVQVGMELGRRLEKRDNESKAETLRLVRQLLDSTV